MTAFPTRTPPQFLPPKWMRPPMIQTGLASQKFRRRGADRVLGNPDSHIIETGDGVKLLGLYNPHPHPKCFVIFLHGWEGSAHSTYVASCAKYVAGLGASVFRLNYRDHGDTHHLNEAPFHSGRLDEVQYGVAYAAELAGDLPVYLVGFSLGGNFALRVARELNTVGVNGLSHIVAVSPVIDPVDASPYVDKHPLVRRYFLKKMRASLDKKQAAFPDLYDFSAARNAKTVLGLTDVYLELLTGYKDSTVYFGSYGIAANDLKACKVPLTIITSKDDPVVPSGPAEMLSLNDNGRLILTEFGGHNGFFQSMMGPTYYDIIIKGLMTGDNADAAWQREPL